MHIHACTQMQHTRKTHAHTYIYIYTHATHMVIHAHTRLAYTNYENCCNTTMLTSQHSQQQASPDQSRPLFVLLDHIPGPPEDRGREKRTKHGGCLFKPAQIVAGYDVHAGSLLGEPCWRGTTKKHSSGDNYVEFLGPAILTVSFNAFETKYEGTDIITVLVVSNPLPTLIILGRHFRAQSLAVLAREDNMMQPDRRFQN